MRDSNDGTAPQAAPQAIPLSPAGVASVAFGPDGLVPAIVQDRRTREVLMLGFMNREMLERTLATGNAWFWSRSRGAPWLKGETSGNFIRVREVRRNCYDNSLLLLVDPVGPVCHTGAVGCYYRTLAGDEVSTESLPGTAATGAATAVTAPASESAAPAPGTVEWLWQILVQRQTERPDGSYVVSLLDQGVDRIAKKLGEEAAEVIIAAKNRSAEEVAAETADLWFFSLLVLLDAGVEPQAVFDVLARRHPPER